MADLEQLRCHLCINKWVVFGGSWGSTLSLVYAQQHPDHVVALILRGIFTLRRYGVAGISANNNIVSRNRTVKPKMDWTKNLSQSRQCYAMCHGISDDMLVMMPQMLYVSQQYCSSNWACLYSLFKVPMQWLAVVYWVVHVLGSTYCWWLVHTPDKHRARYVLRLKDLIWRFDSRV